MREAEFRFYEELNDFLPPARRKRSFTRAFLGTPAVKDLIEACGVPHAEVDLVLVDGESVPFTHRLRGGERVSVYPLFESLDITGLTRLRPRPLREPAFILDVHLGRLARRLRLLGFDSRYERDFADRRIVELAARERRIILTRDVGILKYREVTRGYWVRSTDPAEQVGEVVARFDLRRAARPFSRCLACNGRLQPVPKEAIRDRLPPAARRRHNDFRRCGSCDRIYWRGSHHDRLAAFVAGILGPERGG